jgi:CRISPR-associated protein Csm1
MMQTDTMSQLTSPQAVALQVVQWAISALIQWAGRQLPEGYNCHENVAVQRAKELFNWNEAKIGSLRLLFDRVTLSQKQRDRENYVPIQAIENCNPRIPYPLDAIPNTDLTDFKAKILKLPIQQNWENLSFLSLVLEKYGACLGFGKLDEKDACDVALTDLTRITAAVASAIASHPDAAQLRLVAGDLSGIQDFIYTISSDGALKSLRARSFYLELVTEEIVQQLLSELDLPRTSVIYAGGGNLYLLVPDGEEVKETVKRKGKEINRWLKREFQGKVFLAIDTQTCDVETVATPDFVKTWETAIEKVNRQKTLKFA